MQRGKIITLGRHRFMCGDATNVDDVMKLVDGKTIDLVLTDPPYGTKYIGNYNFKEGFGQFSRLRDNPANRYIKMTGNTATETAKKHYDIVKTLSDKLIIWGAQYFTDFLPPKKGWLVWYKHQTLWNHADCELAYTTLKICTKFYEQTWSGACRAGSQTLNPRPCVHPTQKPVELHMKILEDFTKPGDIILDCFGGSGTTLIACEMTGRKCLMMEISPEYCDVIKARYEKLTEGNLPLEVENA